MSLVRFIFSLCSVGVGIDSVSSVTLPGIKKPPASQAVDILNMLLIMKGNENNENYSIGRPSLYALRASLRDILFSMFFK